MNKQTKISQTELRVTDLRIGNWVLYPLDMPKYTDRPDHTEWKPGQITAILLTNGEYQVKIKRHGMPIDLDDCRPIQISKEWIEMAGFKAREDKAWLFDKDDITCHAGGWIKGYGDRTRFKFKYVHELQNICYTLRGWELEFAGISNITYT